MTPVLNKALAHAGNSIDPQALQQALAQLHDIQLPAEPGWWPLATGWWLVMATVVFAVAVALVGGYWWRRTAAKRAALAEWQRIVEANVSDQQRLVALAQLLKRAAMSRDAEVAALTDQRWADYLNQQGSTNYFTTQAGQQLLMARFAPVVKTDMQRQYQAVQQWLKAAL